MRPKEGTYTFTVKERILLHLMEYQTVREYNVPFQLVQGGIAREVGVRRGNVARYLKQFKALGLVEVLKGRTASKRTRTQYYVLSDDGLRAARDIAERAGSIEVALKFPAGEVRVHLADAPSLIHGMPSLAEVASSVRNGRLDVPDFLATRAREGCGEFLVSPDLPETGRFHGRARELELTRSWFAAEEASILSVRGVAGIGKTTLLARAARDWMASSHVFWRGLREYDTAWSLAQDISVFLSSAGGVNLSKALGPQGVDMNALSYACSTTCTTPARTPSASSGCCATRRRARKG
jgi:DNA-binding MarR family transcriptional regulator